MLDPSTRVLVVAYACAPDEGSEPGVGWAWATAAAEVSAVTLLTRANNVQKIKAALALDGRSMNVEVVGVEVGRLLPRLKKALPGGLHAYYLVWQLAAHRRAKKLHANAAFELTHHITFAADWQPAWGATLRNVPLVWGPVAGATYVPRRARPLLPPIDRAREGLREVATRTARVLFGRPTARRARLVIAGSTDTARAMKGSARTIVVEPNVALGPVPEHRPSTAGTSKTIAFIGRLCAWKGPQIAVQALSYLPPNYCLKVFGAGSMAVSLQQLSRNLGLSDRVDLLGNMPRHRLMAQIAQSDCVIAPSLHESIGWAVAEAAAMGVPVVASRVGGHIDVLRGTGSTLVTADSELARRLAAAIPDTLRHGSSPTARFSAERLPSFLSSIYHEAL